MCLFMYSSYILWCRKKKDKQSSHFLRSISFSLFEYSSSTIVFSFFKFLLSFYDKFKFPSEGEKNHKKLTAFFPMKQGILMVIAQLKNQKHSNEVLNFNAMGGCQRHCGRKVTPLALFKEAIK